MVDEVPLVEPVLLPELAPAPPAAPPVEEDGVAVLGADDVAELPPPWAAPDAPLLEGRTAPELAVSEPPDWLDWPDWPPAAPLAAAEPEAADWAAPD